MGLYLPNRGLGDARAGIPDWIEQRIANPLTGQTSGSKLPEQSDEEKAEFLGSVMGQPVALAYGRHLVTIKPAFQELDGTHTILFGTLGDGEWDSMEVLWINAQSQTLPDTAKIHFHPGKDGETGTESVPGTANQKICSFFPGGFTGMTFSRTAYLGLYLPQDPYAPTDAIDVRGIFKTRKVRIFSDVGAETSFAYSANPAWQLLDAYISLVLKPHGTIDEALTTAEKARIDFAAFKAAADYCDADLGGGIKRFESHVVFVSGTTLAAMFETFLALCRGYLQEQDGKLGLYIDQPRTSMFTFERDQVIAGSFALPAKDPRSMTNRLIIKARDMESGGADHTKDFAPWMKQIDREPAQDFVGSAKSQDVDWGANTTERSLRLGNYWLDRAQIAQNARLFSTLDSGALMPGDIVQAATSFATQIIGAPLPSQLSASEIPTFDAAKAVDGDTSVIAWQSAGCPNTAYIRVDFGVPTQVTGVMIYGRAILPCTGDNWLIEFSDDGSAWTYAQGLSAGYWVTTWWGNYIWWTEVHRYWRIRKTYGTTQGEYTELRFLTPGNAWEILEITDEPEGDREMFLQQYDESIFPD